MDTISANTHGSGSTMLNALCKGTATVGGVLFLSGMLIMFYNMVKTIAGQKAYDAPVLAPAGAHA